MSTSSESRNGHLRVCLLTGSFYPVVGGGERHARLLCREMAGQGARMIVLTRRRTSDLAGREFFEGYEIIRVGPCGFPRTGKYWMLLPALRQLIKRRHDYDVIYVCGLRVLGIVGVLAQIITGKPCVLRAEARGEWSGAFIWKSPGGGINRFARGLFKPIISLRNRFLHRARGWLAVSTPIKDEFCEGGLSAEAITLIPNGIDTREFQPASPEARLDLRRRYGFGEARVFMYAGKLIRGKGLEMLLRVWARYITNYPGDLLVLVGSGEGQPLSCEKDLRAFARDHRLETTVRFTGYTEGVADYLRAADCFLFPSESEAQGLAPLEAMACGLPVIASRIPGVMDMVTHGKNGVLIETRNETQWLDALTHFSTDPDHVAIQVRAALTTARENYGIQAVALRHAELFRTLTS